MEPKDIYMMFKDNYEIYTIRDGWYLTFGLQFNNNNCESPIKVMPDFFNSPPSLSECIKNARLHGLIIDEDGSVTGFNQEQFDKTFYLWQGKEIGLL